MEEWEHDLRNVLEGIEHPTNERLQTLREQIRRAYEKKGRFIRYYLYAAMASLLVLFCVFAHQFWQSSDMKHAAWNALCALIMIEGTILVRLWYWIVNTKVATLCELKQLQLQIAELASKPAVHS